MITEFHNPNDYWLQSLYGSGKEFDADNAMRIGCLQAAIYVACLLIGLLVCALLGSCSPKVVESVVTHTDTCYIAKQQRDSVFVKDSVYIREWTANDTVRITTDRWHVQWKEKLVRDTAYISRSDTVRVTKVKEVAKPLSTWQQARLQLANIVLVLLAVLCCITLARWWLKRRKIL